MDALAVGEQSALKASRAPLQVAGGNGSVPAGASCRLIGTSIRSQFIPILPVCVLPIWSRRVSALHEDMIATRPRNAQ